MPLALILHIEDIAAWFKAMCHAANICFLWSGCSGVSDVVSIFMLVGMWARLVGLFFFGVLWFWVCKVCLLGVERRWSFVALGFGGINWAW